MDDVISKRLIYNFYLTEDYTENFANKVHLKCIEMVSHVFSEAIIILSLDDVNNRELIVSAIGTFSKILNCNTITFKVYKNNTYREGYSFYKEIACKLNTYDGLTFFAHNKGYTNKNTESTTSFIIGMWFFNTYFINECENILSTNTEKLFYGAYLMFHENIGNGNGLYAGSCYWMNTNTISIFLSRKKMDVPIISNRCYAENFPGLLNETDASNENGSMYSPKGIFIWGTTDLYNTCTEINKLLAGDFKIEKEYNDFYNLITNE